MGDESPEHIIDAFWHERLGVILICDTAGRMHYLRTQSDGDPVYLQSVTEHLRAWWLGDNATHPCWN